MTLNSVCRRRWRLSFDKEYLLWGRENYDFWDGLYFPRIQRGPKLCCSASITVCLKVPLCVYMCFIFMRQIVSLSGKFAVQYKHLATSVGGRRNYQCLTSCYNMLLTRLMSRGEEDLASTALVYVFSALQFIVRVTNAATSFTAILDCFCNTWKHTDTTSESDLS